MDPVNNMASSSSSFIRHRVALDARKQTAQEDTADERFERDDANHAPQTLPKAFASRSVTAFALLVAVLLLSIVALLARYLSKLAFLRVVILLPAAACAVSALQNRTWQNRLLPLTVLATTIFAQLPEFVGFTFAASSIVWLSLNTLPSRRRERNKQSPMPVFVAVIFLVTILLTENFMVWVVSATFEAGQQSHTAPPPLQDNGRTLIQFLTQGLTKREVIGLRRICNCQGALVACLGTSFVMAEVYGRRKLFSLGCRAVVTLAVARTIRTTSFLVTVLPSQNKSCYIQHYPYPPPMEWGEWIWVGLMPAAHGGCNDLIISGHATVTSTLACVAASVSNNGTFCVALWTMVVFDYMIEVFEGFHYSVDMWLGMVLVCLLWRVLEPIEGKFSPPKKLGGSLGAKNDATENTCGDLLPWNATAVVYSLPAFVALLQLILLPKWTANFLIVFYTILTAVLYLFFSLRSKDPGRTAAFQHMGQHVLYCLLFMALGIYL